MPQTWVLQTPRSQASIFSFSHLSTRGHRLRFLLLLHATRTLTTLEDLDVAYTFQLAHTIVPASLSSAQNSR